MSGPAETPPRRKSRAEPRNESGGDASEGAREHASLEDLPALRVEITRDPHAMDLPLPAAATVGAAGLDLRAAVMESLILAPGSRQAIPTGFRIAIPQGFEAQIRPRSGLALRHGILIPNAPGTIDSDYRGEIQVILMNAGDADFEIERGDRIAQLVIAPVVRSEWLEVEALDATDRGGGGFGHTGKR